MDAVEEIALVQAPPEAYLDALGEIRDEVDAWFAASIEGAHDDIKRENEESKES